MRRIESPSSILMHRHCPRKYYYHYIEKLPTKPNMHTVRGNIVHSVLDKFFANPPTITENDYFEQCVQHLRTLYDHEWENRKSEFAAVGMQSERLHPLYVDTLAMISLWLENFFLKLTSLKMPVQEAFRLLTPLREEAYMSEKYAVRGYIDVIEQHDGDIRLMDYKTSARAELNEYRLQLAIYALLYQEKHGRPPTQVGVYFLKHPQQFEQTIHVGEGLLDEARFAIETHHLATTSGQIEEYPRKTGPMCKWSTGECDFYKLCFPSQLKLNNF